MPNFNNRHEQSCGGESICFVYFLSFVSSVNCIITDNTLLDVCRDITKKVFTWKERLQIAIDTAGGKILVVV